LALASTDERHFNTGWWLKWNTVRASVVRINFDNLAQAVPSELGTVAAISRVDDSAEIKVGDNTRTDESSRCFD
jgi:hypothetical protein